MPAYKIRPASRDDSLAIRYLVRQARVNPFGLDWRHFVVAEFGGETVIGCGQVKLHIERQGETSRELASIVVTPGWRGKGVASSVIANLLSQNSCPIYLTCRASFRRLLPAFWLPDHSSRKNAAILPANQPYDGYHPAFGFGFRAVIRDGALGIIRQGYWRLPVWSTRARVYQA